MNSTTPAAKDPLAAFTKLNESVYFYQPPPSTSSRLDASSASNDNAPDLVVCLTWASAPTRALAKYTARYALLYPSARILLVQTSFSDMVLASAKSQRQLIAPALDVLCAASPDERLLFHVLSNGGSYRLMEVAKAYREAKGTLLPMHALVFDSSPGMPHYRSTARSLRSALPSAFYLHFPMVLLIWAWLLYLTIRREILGIKIVVEIVWKALNDPELIDVKAKRLYSYSNADLMVAWEDVREHAAIARAAGWDVREEEFPGSKHVALAVAEPERYWRLIEELWTRASS